MPLNLARQQTQRCTTHWEEKHSANPTQRTLRAELAQLKQERNELIKIAGAALVLVNDMDEDTFESFEAAELVASYINHLPEPVLDEAMKFAWA